MAALTYLAVQAQTADCFMGGLLTVNDLGLPTEFIYSEPIRPSKLQIGLYGTTLGRYVMVDVIGKGLLDGSQARGAPVVVGSTELLALATRSKRPLLHLSATNQRPLGDAGDIHEGSDTEFAAQLDEVRSPYIVRIYDRVNFVVEQHLPTLMECAARFDPLEPLDRIRRTLEVIQHDAG